MARKVVGYVQLEWTCPNCGTRNPGPVKTCKNCGAPQPENVQFQRAAQEKLVTDEQSIQAAQAGADYICPYCGTRNRGDSKVCTQCGGDLVEAKRRASGAELQAASGPAEVACTNCGTVNPAANTNCSKCGSPLPRAAQDAAGSGTPTMGSAPSGTSSPAKPARKTNWFLWGGLAGALLLCCIAGLFLFLFPASSVHGTVQSVHWQTSVPLEEQHEVRYTDEQGSPPSDAYDVSCHTESHQVCEQRTIDQGNGYGQVVEDCHDESTDYCSYTVMEWQTIQTYTLEGYDLQPVYDDPSYSSGQRLGKRAEELTVTFSTDKGNKSYSPDTIDEFQQFQIGSTWTLKLNALGSVIGVEP